LSETIALRLPENADTHLQARCAHSKIASDYFITLDPRITKINDEAWKMIEQNIEGTIGDGEAEIVLHAENGNIVIKEALA
jgi:hypothetical protein